MRISLLRLTSTAIRWSLEIVNTCDDARWRVEAIQLDRGTGLRSWFEVHGPAGVFCCSTADQVLQVLAAHDVATADLAPPRNDAPADQDGCE